MSRLLYPSQYLLGCQGLALLRRWLRPDLGDVAELLASTEALARDSSALEPFEVDDYSVEECYRLQQETYETGWNPLIELEERAVRPLVAAGAGLKALDAACGTGRHGLWLASQGYAVTGVDTSAAMVAVAQKALPDGDFKVGTLESLPVQSSEFDLAICALALALCADIAPPIAELARAVRPGGKVVISDIHPVSVMLGGSLLFEVPDGKFGVTQQNVFWHASYFEAFAQSGLQVRRCLDIPWHPSVWPGDWYATDFEQRGIGQLFSEISQLALEGVPGLLVWELERL